MFAWGQPEYRRSFAENIIYLHTYINYPDVTKHDSCQLFVDVPSLPFFLGGRVRLHVGYTYTGLDYLGPLYVKENSESVTHKVWVCLFTCLAVRAVQLELINDMSAEQFLLCLRRFIARRGKPKEIISDNASQFKLAKSTVDEAWQFATTSPDTQSYLANEEITWSFIIKLAPWMGSFYERLVGLVIRPSERVLARSVWTLSSWKLFLQKLKRS